MTGTQNANCHSQGQLVLLQLLKKTHQTDLSVIRLYKVCLNLKLSMHWRQIFPSLHTICLKLTKGRQCLFGFTWFQLIFRLIYHQWCDKTGLSNCSLSLSVTWSYEQRFKMVCLQHGINCLNAVIYYGQCAQLHLARSQACRLKKKRNRYIYWT